MLSDFTHPRLKLPVVVCRQKQYFPVPCYCLTYSAHCHFCFTDVFRVQIQAYLRILFISLAIGGGALYAEKLRAQPLSGTGDFEFLFFASEKKPEIDGLTARFAELGPELQSLQTELKKTEEEIKNFNTKGPAKKNARLEWSPIEGVTGYSIRLFDSAKKPIGAHSAEENFFTIDLEPGDYYFQVAAVTKFKTGTYSRLTLFKVSKGKPGAAQLAAEERAEQIREKIRIQKSVRGEYLKTLRAAALGSANAQNAEADLSVPADAAVYLAVNKGAEPYSMSAVSVIPGRTLQRNATPAAAPVTPEKNVFYWGVGAFGGPQDTGNDPNNNPYFRWNLGLEGFVRNDRAYFGFLRTQLKLQAAYSPAKTTVFDSMVFANLYPGVYFPLKIGQRFTLIGSVATGANIFMVLSSAGSGLVLQWGVMPAVEFQYEVAENLSLYMGGAINFTYDTSGKFLKFIPVSMGITRRF